MQGLTGNVFHVRVVEIVSDQRIAQIFHMDPDLMGAAGLQAQGDQAVPVSYGDNLIVGDRGLAFLPVYNPFDDGAFPAGERGSDGAGFRHDMSSCYSQVFPADFFALGHGGQDTGADQMFCHHGKAGGVPVQTVAAAEDEGFPLLQVVPGQAICQRVGIVVQGRMDGHAGRFVHYDQVFIFIDNVKRKLDGQDLAGAFCLLDMDAKFIAGGKCVAQIAKRTVYQDAFRHLFDLGQVLGRVAFSPQELFDPKAGFCLADVISESPFHCISSMVQVE